MSLCPELQTQSASAMVHSNGKQKHLKHVHKMVKKKEAVVQSTAQTDSE